MAALSATVWCTSVVKQSRSPVSGTSGRQGKAFFSEEKKQKTFGRAVAAFPSTRAKGTKVFWFFFSKKNRLLRLSPVKTCDV